MNTGGNLETPLAEKPLLDLTYNSIAATQDMEVEGRDIDVALEEKNESKFSFNDMRLRVGDRIQLEPPANVASDRYLVKLIGYVDNIGLLVTAPFANGMRVPLRETDKIVARVFTSQRAFGFGTQVERVCKIPYDYLHLSFPTQIQGSIIRKAPRVRTKIIASIGNVENSGSGARQSGIITNLSADGALVKAKKSLTDKGGAIDLSFRVTLHGIDALLSVSAIVRSTFEDQGGDTGINHGVQFQKLQPNDRVILQSLIYQHMIEQPQSLT